MTAGTRDGDGPRKDDRVRIVLDGKYVREGDPTDHDGGFAGYFVDVDGVMLYVPPSATVEVLERAEPTCRAVEGATGIACQLPRHHALEVQHEGTHSPNESCNYALFVRWPWQDYDPDFPSPARPSVRVENTPHGPSTVALTLMRNRISAGRPVEAVRIAHDAGMEWAEANRYVEDMAEYQAHVSEYGEPVGDDGRAS